MPTKRLIATVEDASCAYGRGTFTIQARVSQGYTNVVGKGIAVDIPAETLADLVQSYARMKSQVGGLNTYEATRNGAEYLRTLANELDAEAEAMPPWMGKRGVGSALVKEEPKRVTFGTPELLEQATRDAEEDEAKEDEATYKIVRFYQDDTPSEVIETGLTLEEAQAHCRREDTHGEGWFDGYEKEA